MTPESRQIVALVDEFDDAERANMRDAIMEIARAYSAARTDKPRQLKFVYPDRDSNVVVGPWVGSCAAKRKPPKRAPRKRREDVAREPG